MTEKERIQYVNFMTDVANAYECANCPENKNCSSWGGNLPCGQQNCWVLAHCRHAARHDKAQ